MIQWIFIFFWTLSCQSATIDASSNTYTAQIIIPAILCISCGLFFLFFGYKLLKPTLFLVGFYIFTILGYAILVKAEPSAGYVHRDSVLLFGSLAIGLIGAFLSLFIFRLGLFILGALAGLTLALFILSFNTNGLISSPLGKDLFMAAMALLGGIVIHFFEKPLIILCTSLSGSYSFFFGLDLFTKIGFADATATFLGKSLDESWFETNWKLVIMLVSYLILAFLGAFVQFRTTAHIDHRRDRMAYHNKNPSDSP